MTVGLIACGATVEAPERSPPYRAGTRLRPVVHEAEHSRRFSAWFDTELGVQCLFDRLNSGPDGVSYCVPGGYLPGAAPSHEPLSGPFADAACTDPVATTSIPDVSRSFVIVRSVDTCAAGPSFHAAGAAIRAALHYRSHDGSCTSFDPPGVASDAVRIGAPLSKPPFVSAVETNEARGGRIDARVLVASDGSTQIVAGFDRERGEPVSVSTAQDGRERWMPERVAFVGGHGGCDGPVATKIRHNAQCPITVAIAAGPCALETHAVGAPLSRDQIAARCGSPANDVFVFELGPIVAPDTFAEALVFDIGTPTGTVRGYGAQGAGFVMPGPFVVGPSQRPCLVAKDPSGDLRCFPRATNIDSNLFADAACTAPAASRTTWTGVCSDLAPGTPVTRAGATFVTAETLTPIYKIDGQRKVGEQCVSAGDGYALRRIPEESFPSAIEIVE